MTTPTAIVAASLIIALTMIFHPFGPTYSFMPFGQDGTAALRLNAQTGAIDVCYPETLPNDLASIGWRAAGSAAADATRAAQEVDSSRWMQDDRCADLGRRQQIATTAPITDVAGSVHGGSGADH